ncbi:MAG: hypothetical protein KTR31_18860 [Myxococcales bacterium]|nr:hypothetical protein [Myxococcales bacterium]
MFLLSAVLAAHAGGFTPGQLIFVSQAGDVTVVAQGDTQPATPLASLDAYAAGQLAFSADLQHVYVPLPNDGVISEVSADGQHAIFATGLSSPTGLLLTSDGRLLATEWDQGTVVDITEGGDVSEAVPLVTGLQTARHLLQSTDGRVFVSDQWGAAVHDVGYPDGGPVGAAYATGIAGIKALLQLQDGRLLASGEWDVFDITGGGDFFAAAPHATGADLIGLAELPDGTVLANTYLGDAIYDVTAGGDLSATPPWASGLAVGDTTMAVVPAGPSEPPDTGPTPPGPTVDVPTDPTGDTSDTGTQAPSGDGQGCGCVASPGSGAVWMLGLLVMACGRTRRTP